MWWRFLYTLGLMNVEGVAQRALGWYAGRSETQLRDEVAIWFRERVVPHISDAARAAVRKHLDAGDLVAIASGATLYACEPMAAELEIPHIVCTELEVKDGRLSGKAIDPLCYGHGKLRRSKQFLERHGAKVSDAIVYSDSVTDLPLLEASATPVAVNPDPRLRRMAEIRGWRIEVW